MRGDLKVLKGNLGGVGGDLKVLEGNLGRGDLGGIWGSWGRGWGSWGGS